MARNLDKPNKPMAVDKDGNPRKPDNIQMEMYSLPSTREITKKDINRANEKRERLWPVRFDQTRGVKNTYPKIVASILVPTGSNIKPRPTRAAKFGRQTRRAKNPAKFPNFEENLYQKYIKTQGKLIHRLVWGNITDDERKQMQKVTRYLRTEFPHWWENTQEKMKYSFRCEGMKRIQWVLKVNKRWMQPHEILPEKAIREKSDSWFSDLLEKGKIQRWRASEETFYNLT